MHFPLPFFHIKSNDGVVLNMCCTSDEYILPKIAERDLRRFANLRHTSSHLGVELPLDKVSSLNCNHKPMIMTYELMIEPIQSNHVCRCQ